MTTKKTELKAFTFPSTGKVVHYKRQTSVAMLTMDLANDPTNPKPLPPLQKIEINGRVTHERNYFDPRYEKIVKDWENAIEMQVAATILEDAVINLTDADKKEVARKREEKPRLTAGKNDREVWLKYIAIGCDDDLRSFLLFVRGVSEPTEEGISANAAGFPDNAKGS